MPPLQFDILFDIFVVTFFSFSIFFTIILLLVFYFLFLNLSIILPHVCGNQLKCFSFAFSLPTCKFVFQRVFQTKFNASFCLKIFFYLSVVVFQTWLLGNCCLPYSLLVFFFLFVPSLVPFSRMFYLFCSSVILLCNSFFSYQLVEVHLTNIPIFQNFSHVFGLFVVLFLLVSFFAYLYGFLFSFFYPWFFIFFVSFLHPHVFLILLLFLLVLSCMQGGCI